MTFYFERNGYDVNFIARNSADKVEVFEEAVLNTISNDNRPFFTVVDFGDSKFNVVYLLRLLIIFFFASDKSKSHSSTKLSPRW